MQSRLPKVCNSIGLLLALAPGVYAQGEMALILERLDRLERQNRELTDEIRALRAELATAKPEPGEQAELADRLAVQERRVEEHAQTKVESSQKLPIRMKGMILFNSFLNT